MSNLPLDIAQDVWEELHRKEQNRLRFIDVFDLSFLPGRPMHSQGVKFEDISLQTSAVIELKKYMAIKILYSPHPMGMFGAVVVAAWKSFILHTEIYHQFCNATYESYIHHVPAGFREAESNSSWIEFYHKLFGEFPTVWFLDLSGNEIPDVAHSANVMRDVRFGDMDSDDGAYGCNKA